VTSWAIREAAEKHGLSQRTERHRDRVRQAAAAQQEGLQVLDSKMGADRTRLATAIHRSQG
jgi:hypothetical protein